MWRGVPWLLLRAIADSLGSPLEELQQESSSLHWLAEAIGAQCVCCFRFVQTP